VLCAFAFFASLREQFPHVPNPRYTISIIENRLLSGRAVLLVDFNDFFKTCLNRLHYSLLLLLF